MMKRNLLAVMIPALLAAGAVNAAEVYNKDGNKLNIGGKFQASHVFSDNNPDDGDKTYMRLLISGESQITEDFTGYFGSQIQWEVSGSESKDETRTRLAFVGVKMNDYGSLDYGRNWGAKYKVTGWTDVLPDNGGDAAPSDSFMNARSASVLTFNTPNFFGLVDDLAFTAQYQGKNESTHRSNADLNGDGHGYALTYALPYDLHIGVAATFSDRLDKQSKDKKGDHADSYAAGIKYDANNLYLAAIYDRKDNMQRVGKLGTVNKTENYEVVAQYLFDEINTQVSAAFITSKAKDTPVAGCGDSGTAYKYTDLGVTYFFNKNLKLIGEYAINHLKEDNCFTKAAGLNHEDKVTVGFVYTF